MFILLVGMVIGWGIWMIRMLNQWQREEREWAEWRQQVARIEKRRIDALNIRPSSK